jgi:acetyl esterase/lipase
MARSVGVATVSVRYRLAPEHPFPAGLDDCVAAARWVIANAVEVFGTGKVVIAGNSAGGYLAAQTLLRLRDHHPVAFGEIVAASLVFGVYDLGLTPSVRAATPQTLVLNSTWIDQFFAMAFPGRSSERLREPEFSPLYADLTGMPPALFTVGDLDPLLDDSVFMASRWRLAGNESALAVWPESPHGFIRMAPPTGLPAQQRINEWLGTQLAE